MRILVLLLLMSIPIAAGTVESATVTCEGVLYQGSGSASCSDVNLPYYSVSAEASSVLVRANEQDGGASASFTADFVLTVTGGSGDGFFDPQLYATATSSGNGGGGAQARLWDQSGNGCSTTSSASSLCIPASLPFVFGVPDLLTLSLYASAVGAPGDAWGLATYGPFEFYDSIGQPMNGVSYTLVPVGPVPEPGTLLLTAAVCGVLTVFNRRRRVR